MSRSQTHGGSRRAIVAASVVASAAIFACASAARAQFAVNPASGDVNVDQVQYANSSGTDLSSNGEVLINETQLATDSHITNGYIQVFDSSGNALVQNMPMVAGMPVEAAQFALGTPDGTNETGTNDTLSVEVTAAPVANYATFVPTAPTPFSVGGEEVDGTQGEGAPAYPNAVAKSNLSFSLSGKNRISVDLGMPNVQAADNQCGPAALANALTWEVKNNPGFPSIPDANNPGRGALAGTPSNPNNVGGPTFAANTLRLPTYNVVGGVPQEKNGTLGQNPLPGNGNVAVAGDSLVGALDLTIARSSNNRISGDETVGNDQVPGLEKYLGGANVGDTNVRIDTEGTGKFTNNNITNNPYDASASYSDFLYNEMAGGSAIKIGYTGHAEVLDATGSILGQPWVILQSDMAQTSQNDLLDAKLNGRANLPNGYTNADTIPVFSYLNDSTKTLPGLGVNLFNAIAINVPEPGTLGLGMFALSGLMLRRRRAEGK